MQVLAIKLPIMMDWQSLRHDAKADLEAVVADLGAVPDMLSQVEVYNNNAFPLRVNASLNTGGPSADETVVLSADFQWIPGGVKFTCDILLEEDNEILAELPEVTVALGEDAAVEGWARSCLKSFHELCTSNVELIRLALEQGRE